MASQPLFDSIESYWRWLDETYSAHKKATEERERKENEERRQLALHLESTPENFSRLDLHQRRVFLQPLLQGRNLEEKRLARQLRDDPELLAILPPPVRKEFLERLIKEQDYIPPKHHSTFRPIGGLEQI